MLDQNDCNVECNLKLVQTTKNMLWGNFVVLQCRAPSSGGNCKLGEVAGTVLKVSKFAYLYACQHQTYCSVSLQALKINIYTLIYCIVFRPNYSKIHSSITVWSLEPPAGGQMEDLNSSDKELQRYGRQLVLFFFWLPTFVTIAYICKILQTYHKTKDLTSSTFCSDSYTSHSLATVVIINQTNCLPVFFFAVLKVWILIGVIIKKSLDICQCRMVAEDTNGTVFSEMSNEI